MKYRKLVDVSRDRLIEDLAYIPERYHRKPKILRLHEPTLVVLAFISSCMAYGLRNETLLFATLCLACISALISAYFLATENAKFRSSAILSASLFMISGLCVSHYIDSAIFGMVAIFIAGLYLYPYVFSTPCKTYYLWCKTLDGTRI